MHFEQKEQSSYKITLLLYIIILLLPFSFYFVYTSFDSIKKDTEAVRQSSRVGGMIEYIALNPKNIDNHQTIRAIDQIFQSLSTWSEQNNDSVFYIGPQTLVKDFSDANTCWNTYKEKMKQNNTALIQQQSSSCWQTTDDLAIIIENMVYMKQNKIINMFYISLALTMMIILLLIYMIRAYIHIQMKKHAIYDQETTLFNKKYLLAECKSSTARAVRHEYPLSLIKIEIEGFEKGSTQYDKNTKLHTLKALGTLIHTLVRDGDIPSRYDENGFLILLPHTNKEGALVFEKRIRQAMMQDDDTVSEKIKLNFTIDEFDKIESGEAFIQRALAT